MAAPQNVRPVTMANHAAPIQIGQMSSVLNHLGALGGDDALGGMFIIRGVVSVTGSVRVVNSVVIVFLYVVVRYSY